LERDNVKEALQTIDSLRNLDLFGLASCKFLVVWIADNNGPTTTSNDLLVSIERLREDIITGENHDDWEVFIDQGQDSFQE